MHGWMEGNKERQKEWKVARQTDRKNEMKEQSKKEKKTREGKVSEGMKEKNETEERSRNKYSFTTHTRPLFILEPKTRPS